MVQFYFHENSTRNKPEDKNMFLLCNIIGKFENLTHFRQDTVLILPEKNDEQGRVHVIRKEDTKLCYNKGILGNKYEIFIIDKCHHK